VAGGASVPSWRSGWWSLRWFIARVDPGIHYALPWPIDSVQTLVTTDVKRIDVGFTFVGELMSEARQSDMLTGDENILKIKLVVQYKIRDPVDYLFRAEEPRWLVERAIETALNRRVACLPVDDVLTTAKGQIQVDALETAQDLLDRYESGIVLLGANLQIVTPPVPVISAFKEVASAKKDSERLIDEAREYEGQVLPEARGKAQQMINQAQGVYADRVNRARGDSSRFLSVLAEYQQAKQVTRTRLFVDAMERLFAKMKVIIVNRRNPGDTSRVTIVD
jgi:membrane protease subunit HflK